MRSNVEILSAIEKSCANIAGRLMDVLIESEEMERRKINDKYIAALGEQT